MDHFQELSPNDTFRFSCHPGVSCFNQCCRDLNHFLTPYDVVRLKNRLGLSSQEFLHRYTHCHRGPRSSLPMISLKMSDQKDLKCPFVSPRGCTVYEDRPGACRTYPLGRLVARQPQSGDLKETYFLIRESHCLGFSTPKNWNSKQWADSQRLETYNKMNDLMMEVLTRKNQSGKERLTDEEADLFHMACYDLDRFREYAIQKRLSGIPPKGDDSGQGDVALMRFSIKWIQDALFGK